MIEIRFGDKNDANIVYGYLIGNDAGAYHDVHVRLEEQMITIHIPATEQRYVEDILIPTLVYFILTVKEDKWIISILEQSFLYVDIEEQNQILHIAHSLLAGKRCDIPKRGLEDEREDLLFASLRGFVHESVSFSFESYVRFRLRHYMTYLEHLTELAIDEYKLEQEYQTFIETLRQHVSRQKARLSCLHVVYNGSFIFYDEKGLRLNQEKLVQYINESVPGGKGMYIDTNVMAPLLSIAPKIIYLYTSRTDDNMIITIRNVFQERVIVYPVGEFNKIKEE